MTVCIDTVWNNIIKYEGEPFETIRKKSYTYTVGNDFILINNDKRRKIKKEKISLALRLDNLSPSQIQANGIWGPSYVYGIITDSRIISEAHFSKEVK
ncbi:MAG: hypothetical protein IKU43_01435 [Clostridia bacterium]|nr:hypothetical protein [Clostridia bacterium]